MPVLLENWAQTSADFEDPSTGGFVIELPEGNQRLDPSPQPSERGGTLGAWARADEVYRQLHRLSRARVILDCAPPRQFQFGTLQFSPDTSGFWLRPTEERERANWEIRNARRGELLLKRLSGDLTQSELRELAALQALALRKVNELAVRRLAGLADLPSPPADMLDIVDAA